MVLAHGPPISNICYHKRTGTVHQYDKRTGIVYCHVICPVTARQKCSPSELVYQAQAPVAENRLDRGWFWTLRVPRKYSRSFLSMLLFVLSFQSFFLLFFYFQDPFISPLLAVQAAKAPTSVTRGLQQLLSPDLMLTSKVLRQAFWALSLSTGKQSQTEYQNSLWIQSKWDKLS